MATSKVCVAGSGASISKTPSSPAATSTTRNSPFGCTPDAEQAARTAAAATTRRDIPDPRLTPTALPFGDGRNPAAASGGPGQMPRARTRKVAICSRLTAPSGQKRPGAQPVVTPASARRLAASSVRRPPSSEK